MNDIGIESVESGFRYATTKALTDILDMWMEYYKTVGNLDGYDQCATKYQEIMKFDRESK